MLSFKKVTKIICLVVISLIILEFFIASIAYLDYKKIVKNNDAKNIEYFSSSEENLKMSWENETQIKLDAERKGPGEQGLPFELTDPVEIKKNQKLFKVEGFYVLVSDRISYNRALPDKRPEA
jgi:hypothetical protein